MNFRDSDFAWSSRLSDQADQSKPPWKPLRRAWSRRWVWGLGRTWRKGGTEPDDHNYNDFDDGDDDYNDYGDRDDHDDGDDND